MSKIVKDLLIMAIALVATTGDAGLKDCIEAVEFLGDEAKGNTQEYKDLKAKVEELQNAENGDDEKPPTPPKEETEEEKLARETAEAEDLKKFEEEEKAKLEAKEKAKKPTEKKKKLSYMGIKMIGNRWYSMKDKYNRAFETADDCAKHFNK